MNNSYSEEEIIEELYSLNIANIEIKKVIRFTTSRSRQENKRLPIFIVQLAPQSEINNLKKVKYLFHQLISWDKLMRRETIQCKKCQRIGHAASNLPHRCVKCSNKHDLGKCSYPTQTQIERSKLYYINCNKYGHPASYRGCPKIIENKKRLNILNTNNIKRTVNKTNTHINKALVKPEFSYSDITKRTTQKDIEIIQQKNNTRTNINNTYDITKDDVITEIKNNIIRLEKNSRK